jgi:hypothetical protein
LAVLLHFHVAMTNDTSSHKQYIMIFSYFLFIYLSFEDLPFIDLCFIFLLAEHYVSTCTGPML